MKKIIQFFLSVTVCSAALSGCTLPPVSASTHTSFMLTALPKPVVHQPQYPQALLVTLPDSNALYDTKQMVYSTSPLTVAYFSKNRWAETPARMLQTLIVQALQNTHIFLAVNASPALGQYDWVLATQLVTFEQQFQGSSSYVVITLKAQLVKTSNNQIMASRQFSVRELAPENSPYGGAVAANHAAASLLAELMEMVESSIAI